MKQLLFIAFLLVFSASRVQAQNPPETLTNAKIITMVKGGLPKSVIVASIQNKAANFDLSTDGMIALKKQGVPDDILTAMVQKKPAVEASLPIVENRPINKTPVNPKDCKFTERKGPDGKVFKFSQTSCKNGNLLLCRSGGKYTIIYDTKALLAFLVNDSKNQAVLKVDSVVLDFGAGNVLSVKAVNSYGKLANSNNQLQPQLLEVHLAIALEPNSRAERLFLEKPLKFFLVRSEKDGKYADVLNDKQQASWLQAIQCMPDNN